MNKTVTNAALGVFLTISMQVPLTAAADSGFYIGGSAGGATLEANLGDTGIPGFPSDLDEDDTAIKVFAGYTFDLPSIDLAIEAGYVDFGEPDIDVLGTEVVLDTTGINLWGIAVVEAGPVDLFAKLGYIAWDLEVSALGNSTSADDTEIGYGVGLSFDLGLLKVRGEYEAYDLDDADLSMLSLGLVYEFD